MERSHKAYKNDKEMRTLRGLSAALLIPALAMTAGAAFLASCKGNDVNEPVEVTGVSVSPSSLSLTEGESGKLTATVKPDDATDKSVTLTSSDSEVATVDQSGNVTAVREGSAAITVTTGSGGKTAGCAVTVTATALAEVVFADAKFKAALISSGVDANGDGMISGLEAEAVAEIRVDTYTNSITSLGGIEKFTNLISLSCGGSSEQKRGGLKSLDLSSNNKLRYVYCHYNQLTSLILGDNTELKFVRCESNQLTSLDISKNTALTDLTCYSNQLTSLDISKNTALTDLTCYSNQLTSLDVSKNTALTYLFCYSNQLTSLDVSKNTALTYLFCYSNQLASLDVSKNTALTFLYCYSNQLASLDVSKNTALTNLYCYSNQLASLDVSKNLALRYLVCSYNLLTSLDISKNTALTELNCSNMSTLITLYMASGQVIDYINGTGDKARSTSHIPAATTITVK